MLVVLYFAVSLYISIIEIHKLIIELRTHTHHDNTILITLIFTVLLVVSPILVMWDILSIFFPITPLKMVVVERMLAKIVGK